MIDHRYISSQRYLDEAIVAEKRAEADYAVQYVPVAVDGEELRVIVDGHHSLAAASADGVEPGFELASLMMLAEARDIDPVAYPEAHQMDSDWYRVATGALVW